MGPVYDFIKRLFARSKQTNKITDTSPLTSAPSIKPIYNLQDAIAATLAFYGLTEKEAARKRADIDLATIPWPLRNLYDQLGGVLETSAAAGEYGPLLSGCFDLEYPTHIEGFGLMIMSDVQNGPMMRLSDDRTLLECSGHDPSEFWAEPIETFLTDWLVNDWTFRMRWQYDFPADPGNVLTFQQLQSKLTPVFVATVMGQNRFFRFG